MADYLTLSGLKTTLGVTTTANDADLSASITAASRAVDKICRRRFSLDSAANPRYYSPINSWCLLTDDIATTTGLVLVTRDDGLNVDTDDGNLNTWTLNTDFVLEPLNAAGTGDDDVWPWWKLTVMPTGSFVFNRWYPRSAKVTAKWGWEAIPKPVVEATQVLAERLYKVKKDSYMGVLEFNDVAVRIARLDSSLMLLLGPYIKQRIAVG